MADPARTVAPGWRRWLRARLARGRTLGPNEARLLFDAAAALGAAAAALGLRAVADEAVPPAAAGLASALQAATFLGAAAALGLYGRRRTSPLGVKLRRLTAAVAAGAAAGAVAGAGVFVPLAWAAIAAGPVLLARAVAHTARAGAVPLRRLVTDGHAPVAILGGAGYIGTHTIEALLARGHRVRVLDRLMYGRDPIAAFLDRPDVELVTGDVTDIARLTEALIGCRAVVHLAGLVGDPACAVDEDFTAHANIVATRMAYEVARSLGVSRFVFASSCSVYGVADAEVDEQSPARPVSLYARTKLDSERELLRVADDHFFVTVLRFATVFGHSRRPRFDLVANLFTAQAMTEGRIRVLGAGQWRPFIHARDLARAIVLTLEAPGSLVQSQIFNVGDRRLNRTIGDLAAVVRDAVAPYREVTIDEAPQRPGDARNYAVSFEKIHGLLGFEASVTLEEGIREMAAEFARGGYADYATAAYHNVATARSAADRFHDPAEQARLYAPLERSPER